METIIVAFVVMLALTAAMAVGVIFGRQPIAGSCGGMKALGMEMECEVCGGNPENCEKSAFAPDAPSGFSSSATGPVQQQLGAEELARRVGQ
jgi:hypothetical protein